MPPLAFLPAFSPFQSFSMTVPAFAPAVRSSISVTSSTGTTAGFLVPLCSATLTCYS